MYVCIDECIVGYLVIGLVIGVGVLVCVVMIFGIVVVNFGLVVVEVNYVWVLLIVLLVNWFYELLGIGVN